MKMKLLALLSLTTLAVSAAKPNIKVDATAKPNGNADAASLQGDPLKYVAVVTTGANLITNIETAMQFQFFDSVTGNPVNVQNFKVTEAKYSLYRNDVAIPSWVFQPHGAWNPPGDSATPDLLAYNNVGAQVSTNDRQVTSNVAIPLVSKVQVLRQSISLGTPSRPLFAVAGDKYGLERFWTFTYTYQNVTYENQTLPLGQTYVEILVVPDIPNIPETTVDDGPGPFTLKFQVSENLGQWYTVPFSNLNVTSVCPKTYDEFVVWYPLTENLGGKLLRTDRRFYRLTKEPL